MSPQSPKKARRKTQESLSSILGKVIEQLNLEAFSELMEKKVLRSSQHGFTKEKSGLTNLTAFYNKTTGWVDEG